MELYEKLPKAAAACYRRLRQWKNFGTENAHIIHSLEKKKKELFYPLIETTDHDRRRLARALGQATLSFGVFVILEDCDEKKAAATIASVQRQIYPQVKLYVLDFDGTHRINQAIAQALQESTIDYVWLLPGGCELQELALGIAALYLRDSQRNPALFYTDALLWDGERRKILDTAMKPDYGTDTICGSNFIGNAIAISTEAWQELAGFDTSLHHRFIYDLILRVEEKAGAEGIYHIPQPLVECRERWFTHGPEDAEEDQRLLRSHLCRIGREGQAEPVAVQTEIPCYRIHCRLREQPPVSLLIPNKDNADILMQCVTSVLEKSTYENYEILILENNSERQETFACYRQLETEEKVRILTCKTDWNYSYINNYGAEHAAGEYLLLLNNDTEVITPDWIQEMLSFALRPDVGAVGARLFYPDGTIQHAGVTLGIRGVAGHAFHGASGEAPGYQNRIITAQDLTAVTAACMMIPVEIFREVGGFDESYKVAFNDTDLCMRIRRGGYQVVYQPAAQLYHYESKSRGSDESNPEKLRRFNRESMQFQRQWCKEIYQGDPFYNPNLSIWNDDFTPIDTYRNMT